MDLNFVNVTIFMLPSIVLGVLKIIVHIIFAWVVYKDADKFASGRSTIFVGPEVWFLATLVGGVITAGIYWAMHHSRLSQTADEHPTETQEE